MSSAVPVHEAVEWREPAPGGGSNAQVFRLSDGRFAIVKFPENNQGELVLANEHMSCCLAEHLRLPVNRAVLVSIDERLLRLPRGQNRIPATFSAGIRCGMIRFDGAEACSPADISKNCSNSVELHFIGVFEQFVCRQDGRQLLMYPGTDGAKEFAAYDYGFAFGGQPAWSTASLGAMPPVALPSTSPFTGETYGNGKELGTIIDRLRNFTAEQILETLMKLHPPRWGVTPEDLKALAPALQSRASALVTQFDDRHRKQMEVPL